MKAKRPALVTFIGDLNILSVLFIIASLFPTSKFIEQSGFSFVPVSNFLDGAVRILEVIILLVITYGFLKLKKWGYWAMICYNLFFLIAAIISLTTHNRALYNFGQFFIQSLLALIITFPAERYFSDDKGAL